VSSTLSTQAMVNEILTRCPYNISPAYALGKLNEGFRWIDQNGPTVWRLTYATLTVLPGTPIQVALPANFDPSKPNWLSGGPQWRTTIPYLPWEKFQMLQTTGGSPMAGQGMFSAWTWSANNTAAPATYGYTAWFNPSSASIPPGGIAMPLVYHMLTPAPLAAGSAVFYPTPDAYDDVIVDLAEAEIKRIYSIAGWEMAQKRGEVALGRLAAGTRSTKEVVSELMEQAKQTQERQLARQE